MADGIRDAGHYISSAILEVSKERRRQEEEQAQRRAAAMLETVRNDPTLAQDPVIRKEMSSYFKDKGETLDLFALSRSVRPEVMDTALSEIERTLGLPAQEGVQAQTLGEMAKSPVIGREFDLPKPTVPERLGVIRENLGPGQSLAFTPGKTPRLTMTGESRKDRFEGAFDRVFAEELRNANGDTDLASINATKRAAEELGVTNLPKWASDILTTETRMAEEGAKSDIIEQRERALARFRKTMDVETRRKEAFEAEVGQRAASLAVPKTPAEARAAAARTGGQPIIREPLPASQVKDVTDRQNSLNQLSAAFELMDPEQLGPLAGRFTTMRQAFGALGFEEEQAQATIDMVLRAHRILTTGAAAPPAELAELRRTILNTNMSPAQFAARLTTLAKEGIGQATIYRDTLSNSGYEVPQFRISQKLQDFVNRMSPPPKMSPIGGGEAPAEPAAAPTAPAAPGTAAPGAGGSMSADEFRLKYPHLFRGR